MSEVALIIKEMQEARADWQRILDRRNAEVAKMNLTLANNERKKLYTSKITRIQNQNRR